MIKKIISIIILAGLVFGAGLILLFGQTPSISGAVLPHHNIVASQRTEFFSQLAQRIGPDHYPETIILLSPNHYSAGYGAIQTTDHNWQLNAGEQISANKAVVVQLVARHLATDEPGSFTYEHGIYNILADIHNTFPKAKLVPLIFEQTSPAQLNQLEQGLLQSCNKCLMLASVDFSHYQPAQLADLHDQKSIRDLQTLNTTDISSNAEVDSGAALSLLTLWARDHHTEQFHLQNHTNSDLLLSQPDAEGTSHVFGWYQTGPPVEPQKFVSFVVSTNPHVGVEDRSIWGTDLVITDPVIDSVDSSKMLIAGKLTEQGLEFFGIATDPEKQQALNLLYQQYRKYLTIGPAGNYVSIPDQSITSLDNLSSSLIKSKIKALINLKP